MLKRFTATENQSRSWPRRRDRVPPRSISRKVEDADFEEDFQTEARIHLESENQVDMLMGDTFRFTQEKSRHRIAVIIA